MAVIFYNGILNVMDGFDAGVHITNNNNPRIQNFGKWKDYLLLLKQKILI